VIGHELVHAFQYDISGLGRAGAGLDAAAQRYQVPSWFTEGMAEYLSKGPVDPLTAMWLRDAAIRGELPTIERMTMDPRIFPYRWGEALWAYIGGRWGDAAIGQILKLTGDGAPYEEAFERVLNISLDGLTADWHASIRRAYLPMLAERREARETARPVITATRDGGRLNVAPSLSPDGRRVAFISELDDVDAELYVADARTGQVIRRLQKGAALDPHYGSLRFINSAGTWSPDGRRFALSALRGGHDVLVILDVARGARLREIRAAGVGEISTPTWSPDGRSIVFAGIHGGVSDLFLTDLASGETRALTDDRYAELHPAFSPDGGTIAYSTDRGPGTDLDRLAYGPFRLALLELSSGRVTLAPEGEPEPHAGFASKDLDPVWSADGRALFFISNRDGIPNVYRVSLETGETTRVTNLMTGVSGITDVSPALTGARSVDRILFTSYEDGGYNIYSLSGKQELAGTPLPAAVRTAALERAPAAALLPPVPRPSERTFNRVLAYLGDDASGRPEPPTAAGYGVGPYRGRLGLDYLGQPQIGAAIGGPFGGGLYGGVSGIFSDVLGRRTVLGTVQAQGQLDEIGFATAYVNTRDRWNYGGLAERIPYVYGYYQVGADTLSGEVVPTQDLVRARFFDTGLQGYGQYPFSMVKRVEFSAGVRQIARDFQLYRILLDPATYAPVDQRVEKIRGYSLTMAQATAALVYDDALFGYTSPFAGQRYRFQVTPTVGQLSFTEVLADYRRYLFVRPVTLAVQAMHFGRYGRDSEGVVDDQRVFYDQYLGQPWYVRGYYSAYNDCAKANGGGAACDLLPLLFGSRVAVAKAELRFPLVRTLVLGSAMGVPPVEGFGFVDAGVAWSDGVTPALRAARATDAAEHGVLSSAGVGARVNVFGYLVLEADYVRPLTLERGWRWELNFLPGF
jgi:WD40 repeat protein